MTTNTNRYAILRSIVDGEWLPAPILDTKPEATAYMLGFDAACEALGTGASVLILDLSTGHVDGRPAERPQPRYGSPADRVGERIAGTGRVDEGIAGV